MTRNSSTRSFVAGGLALLVVLTGSVACNKPASTEAGGTVAPAATAAPARGADGGETPQAVVDRMKKAAEAKNFAEVAACLSPKARQEMSAAMYLGATMMVAFSQMGSQMGGAMMEGMAAMGAETSEADKQKAKEQMEKTQKELGGLTDKYNAVMQKHGLPQLPKEGEAQPPEMSKEEMDKIFAKIDHPAFIAEVMAFLESMPGEKKLDEGGPFELKDGTLADLKIDGDKATGTVGGEAMNFVQVDGRWFIDADMMGGPGGAPADAGEAAPAPTS
jgi:hypothetical protein